MKGVDLRDVAFIAGIVAAAIGTVIVVVMIFSGANDCTRSGGHVVVDHLQPAGKVLVPIDKCVGAR